MTSARAQQEPNAFTHTAVRHRPQVPAYFASDRDLFSRLSGSYRPDYRWLIIGGARAGSSWHVDPNATCAEIAPRSRRA